MNVDAPRSLLRAFAKLKDPRMDRTKKHSFPDILAIAICAVICGADGWVQVAQFGRCKEKWFETFLDLPNGIASHDTFGRVFAMLDPKAFEECFMKWITALATASRGRLVSDMFSGGTVWTNNQAGGFSQSGYPAEPTPEPATLGLLLLGGLAMLSRKQR